MARHPFILICIVGILQLAATAAHAQERDDEEYYGDASPRGVAFGLRGGVIVTTPRGVFPSLIVGDSKNGSGTVPALYAESGVGARADLALLIPFTETLGLNATGGTMCYVARFKGDSTQAATRLDAQTVQVGGGLEWSIITDRRSFRYSGLRSVYLTGGVDVTLFTYRNRVESSIYTDSTSRRPIPAVGSFGNADPFRNLVALRGGMGMRFAPEPHLEIITEASYSYGLNPVFSGEVIPNNSFTIDNLSLQIGIGYRF